MPRRRIVERLALGPASMSELADHVGISLPGVDKHLRVLVDASMVSETKHGRSTVLTLNQCSLRELASWAMSTRLLWTGMLDRLGSVAAAEVSGGHHDHEQQQVGEEPP